MRTRAAWYHLRMIYYALKCRLFWGKWPEGVTSFRKDVLFHKFKRGGM